MTHSASQDPRKKYPQPPFPEQPQPAPGLASDMRPEPDHGETSYVGHGRLAGKRALITGGDSGIGRAAAIAFAREGADVAISYLPAEEDDAASVIALIQQEGGRAIALPGDITHEAFCSSMVADAVSQLGGLDIVVNNAGRQQYCESILDLTTADFDATFKTNVYAMFWITKAALPHLQAGASIINTTSVQAYDPSDILLDYAQTKACIVAFTKSLAKQLGPKGIRVNGVAPGPYWTPLQPSGGQPQSKVKAFAESSPLGRPGQPVEIAPLYVLLASDEASYCSGQIWCSNGGTGTL
ncbi:SDR family oxidoreductase [Pluralibacter gergoviae]|uniref:SDR family oxidoreductase n=1 Tax=Pluralibacter gergoviae TaxID=61647 RepID=UPI00155E0AF0|nr:SDR family oxidoreductase [Pluralibacter gergoviae]